MSFLNSVFTALESLLSKVPSSTVATVVGKSVTWSELEKSTQSIGSFFSAMSGAIKEKNLASEAEITVEEVVTIAADLGFGEPFTGILKVALPFVFGAVNDPTQVTAILGSLSDNAGEQQSEIASDRFGR